jgi:cytochrome c553
MSILKKLVAALVICSLAFVFVVYAASEWKIRRAYDIPLVQPRADFKLDAYAGERMAKIVGCWAGCHGVRGEGGVEKIAGTRRVTAPPLGSVIQNYSNAELVRLILHGVKRDGRSAVGMSSFTFWPLGDADIANIVYFLRMQPAADAVERVTQIPFVGRLTLLRGVWSLSADQVNKSQPRWGNMPLTNSYERGRFLAAIVCAECHGADYLGDPLEGGPPLTILATYDQDEFAHLLKTSVSQAGIPIESMSWLPDVEFTDRDIADLYEFLTQ